MTIDKRIMALAQSLDFDVSLSRDENAPLREQMRNLTTQISRLTEAMTRLAHTVPNHEDPLNKGGLWK